MSSFLKYLRLQFKRTAKAYLVILALTLALLAVIGAIAGAIMASRQNDEAFKKVSLGVVGSEDDEILSLGLSMLQLVDSSRLTVEFHNIESEEKAVDSIMSNKIDAYVVVPEDFSRALLRGENKKLKYVMAKNGSNMSSLLTRDVVDVVSNYILETQAGVTAMCDYAYDGHYSSNALNALNMDLSKKYIMTALDRRDISEITEIGHGVKLGLFGYYACTLTVFFLMCFGVACSTLLVKTDRALDRLLYSRGISPLSQVAGEYLPFLAVALLTLLIPLFIAGVASYFIDFEINELTYFLLPDYLLLGFRLIPAITVITAMQFLLYELVSGVVSAVLLQFFVTVILGYISGCFYPISFLPEILGTVSALLPSGLAINYFSAILTETLTPSRLLVTLLYGLLLVAASVAVRYYKICKKEGA